MSFADAAGRLAGLAGVLLGWPPAMFWAATPAELALSLGTDAQAAPPPRRSELLTMIERDNHARPY